MPPGTTLSKSRVQALNADLRRVHDEINAEVSRYRLNLTSYKLNPVATKHRFRVVYVVDAYNRQYNQDVDSHRKALDELARAIEFYDLARATPHGAEVGAISDGHEWVLSAARAVAKSAPKEA